MKKDSSNGIAFSHAIGGRVQMSGRGVKKIPRNNGIATLPPASWAEPGTTIRAEQHNVPLRDIEAMLTNSLPRDGSAPMTGNLPMNSRRITGLGAGVDPSDAARIDQLPPTSVFLTSLASLVAVANQMPYADDTGSAAFAPLTPFARSILDDQDAATARNTIGFALVEAALAILNAVVAHDNAAWSAGTSTLPGIPTPSQARSAAAGLMLGVGQSYQIVTRVSGTVYQNTTGRPILVSAASSGGNSALNVGPTPTTLIQVLVNQTGAIGSYEQYPLVGVIPPGHYYRIDGALISVTELR